MMLHPLLQSNPIEGFFFGSGKAMVVAGVAVIILIGLGLWMMRMEKRIQALDKLTEERLKATNQSTKA